MTRVTGTEALGLGGLLVGVVLLAVAAPWLYWAVTPSYTYSVSPTDRPVDGDVLAYESLSATAQEGIGEAIRSGEAVTLHGDANDAPEFAFGDWCGNSYVEHQGDLYRVCASSPDGLERGYSIVVSSALVATGFVVGSAGLYTSRKRLRAWVGIGA